MTDKTRNAIIKQQENQQNQEKSKNPQQWVFFKKKVKAYKYLMTCL